MKVICLDPGHGMGNKRSGVYDPGACAGEFTEADIVMAWANCLREILLNRGFKVVRTRVDDKDHDPIGKRAQIARDFKSCVMLSLHCNAYNGSAQGTETFFRGKENAPLATRINEAVVKALGTQDRGIKTEGQSQHSKLAVMSFQPCCLLEIGFIDHEGDRAKMLDPVKMKAACEALADALTA